MRCAAVSTVGTAVDIFLREAQVRSWQRELVVAALSAALGSTTDDT
jgi:hypothetical protein